MPGSVNLPSSFGGSAHMFSNRAKLQVARCLAPQLLHRWAEPAWSQTSTPLPASLCNDDAILQLDTRENVIVKCWVLIEHLGCGKRMMDGWWSEGHIEWHTCYLKITTFSFCLSVSWQFCALSELSWMIPCLRVMCLMMWVCLISANRPKLASAK